MGILVKKIYQVQLVNQKNCDIIRAFEINCSNLTELRLRCYFNFEKADDALSRVFVNNKKLKLIHLETFKFLTGECLLSLDRYFIEEIVLIRTEMFKRNHLINSLPTFLRLHTLEFYNICTLGLAHLILGSANICNTDSNSGPRAFASRTARIANIHLATKSGEPRLRYVNNYYFALVGFCKIY